MAVLRIGSIVAETRRAIGWSQRDLASRAGVSQPLVSAIERGRLPDLTISTSTRLLEAMGARLILDAVPPFLGDRERQRDPAHIRCATYVARRLRLAGWEVATEVEVGGDRSRGWIDLLAYHRESRILLVIEIKTEIRDIGAIERSLGWYEREAWAAGRRRGWKPQSVVGCLLLLATEANESRLRENRASMERIFAIRARQLTSVVAGGPVAGRRDRGLALIDPRSRRRDWLRPARVDGRRSPAPYADYIDFLRQASSEAPQLRSL